MVVTYMYPSFVAGWKLRKVQLWRDTTRNEKAVYERALGVE